MRDADKPRGERSTVVCAANKRINLMRRDAQIDWERTARRLCAKR
jgi:hypothetical protein